MNDAATLPDFLTPGDLTDPPDVATKRATDRAISAGRSASEVQAIGRQANDYMNERGTHPMLVYHREFHGAVKEGASEQEAMARARRASAIAYEGNRAGRAVGPSPLPAVPQVATGITGIPPPGKPPALSGAESAGAPEEPRPPATTGLGPSPLPAPPVVTPAEPGVSPPAAVPGVAPAAAGQGESPKLPAAPALQGGWQSPTQARIAEFPPLRPRGRGRKRDEKTMILPDLIERMLGKSEEWERPEASTGLGTAGGLGGEGGGALAEAIEELTDEVRRLADLMERGEKAAPARAPERAAPGERRHERDEDIPVAKRKGSASPSIPGGRG